MATLLIRSASAALLLLALPVGAAFAGPQGLITDPASTAPLGSFTSTEDSGILQVDDNRYASSISHVRTFACGGPISGSGAGQLQPCSRPSSALFQDRIYGTPLAPEVYRQGHSVEAVTSSKD